MFIAGRDKRVVVVADWRQKTDADLDYGEPDQPHALDLLRIGKFAFGRRWQSVQRIALFDHGAKPTNAEAARERGRLTDYIEREKPGRVYIIPTPDSTMGAEAVGLKGTHCWQALHPPDTLDAMRGTRWRYNEHTEVTPLFPVAKRVKELQRWCMVHWMRANSLSTLVLNDANSAITPSDKMVSLMQAMAGRPIAVDLEFNPSTDIVTAVGLSDGKVAVSIPWDRYIPRNNEKEEHGLSDYGPIGSRIAELLADLLRAETKKVAHNFVADIPRLEKKGFVVNGILHDTFAAHAIAFPELRHGLQHAAASLLPVPPWKSLYKPSRLAKNITRDDHEFWVADPQALRDYNTRDAFYTWHLARVVLPHVETTL